MSIRESRIGSLKLGAAAGENPLVQTNIFFRRNESDFLPIAPLEILLSNRISFPLLWTKLYWTSSEHAVAVLQFLLSSVSWNIKFNSFESLPTSSSGVRWSCPDQRLISWRFALWSASANCLILLFPNVPIVSSPSWGQSLNSSLQGCWIWSSRRTIQYMDWLMSQN